MPAPQRGEQWKRGFDQFQLGDHSHCGERQLVPSSADWPAVGLADRLLGPPTGRYIAPALPKPEKRENTL